MSPSFDPCIDYRYICGRDNFQCQTCFESLSTENTYFKKLDTERENITTNLVVSCIKCLFLSAKKFPSKSFSGRLIVITGPMYSEKSTTTESFYNKYKVVYKDSCIWVKPDRDSREAGFTKTHNERLIEAYTINIDRPDQSLPYLLNFKLVVFDEAQFFNERLLYVVHQLLENGCLVIINGLKLTAQRSLFGVMHYLLAEADEIICLKSVCNVCMSIDCATRTKIFTTDSPTVTIGGVDKYYAVDSKCDGSNYEREFLQNFIQRK